MILIKKYIYFAIATSKAEVKIGFPPIWLVINPGHVTVSADLRVRRSPTINVTVQENT